MPGVNFSKIKKIFPGVTKLEEANDLERLASKLDQAEAVEKVLETPLGDKFKDYCVYEIAKTQSDIFAAVSDHAKLIPLVERMRVLQSFYRIVTNASGDAETLRNMVDDYISELHMT